MSNQAYTEDLFRLLQQTKTDEIMNALFVMHRTKDGDLSDVQPFIDAINLVIMHEAKEYDLEKLLDIMMIDGQLKILSEDTKQFLDEKRFDLTEQIEDKKRIARKRPDYDKYKQFLDECTKNESVQVAHSMQDKALVGKTNYTALQEDFTIGLFKSKQEKRFFSAARNAFPNCFVCPNVAISCIINADKIMDDLDDEEKKFFFQRHRGLCDL